MTAKAAIEGAPAQPAKTFAGYTRRKRAWTTVFLMCGAIMNMLDTTIANVALPEMQGTTGASREEITWVLTSYIISLAVATPLTGWLSTRFSSKSVLLGSIGLFTLFSVLCGISTTVEELVLFRIFQGFSGAVLVPMVQSTLLDIYPDEEAGKAMSYFGLGGVTGPLVGPMLGGWLTTNFSWGWVFLVNLPIGVIAFIGIAANMRDTPSKPGIPFDYQSYALLAVAIASFQLMLDRGAIADWFESTEIVIYLIVAIGALASFTVVSAWREKPFIPLRILQDRNFLIAAGVGIVSQATVYSSMALIPEMLAQLYGFPALQIGLTMAPRGAGTVISMLFAARMMRRFGSSQVMITGVAMMCASALPMSWLTLQADHDIIVWSGVLQGLGSAMMFVPMSVLAFSTIPENLRAEAAATQTLLRYLGSAAGISIVQTWTLHNAVVAHADLVGKIDLRNLPPALRDSMAGGNAAQVLDIVNAEVTRQAAMVAYVNSFWALCLASFALIPILLLLRSPASPSR